MSENYIIIHGSFGSKDGNWFPWLKEQLEKQNKVVDVPQMPIGVGNQNFENWSNILNKLTMNENTIIIAHSIAPIFVCKYLITNKIKVKKLIFVCGFNNYLGINEEYDNVNKSMYFDSLEDIKQSTCSAVAEECRSAFKMRDSRFSLHMIIGNRLWMFMNSTLSIRFIQRT